MGPPLPALLLLWLALLAALPASAQPARIKPAPGDDLRSVYANAADIADGKRVADSTCARCHGAQGVSGMRGVPHLAGQRAGYLHAQLRAYQQGMQKHSPMEGSARFLRDDALVNVAAYYASLEPPRAASGKARAAAPDPVQAGRSAAAACSGCHGENGVTGMPGTPSLAGLEPKSFAAAMAAYKSGERRHDLMKSLAASLDETSIGNLALYYALLKPERAKTPVAGDAAAGKAAAAACSGCHGEAGVIYRPEREAQVLRRIQSLNVGPLSNESVTWFFREVMSACLSLEQPLGVAFLGPLGTFSESASTKHFGHAARLLPQTTIDEVFREVEAGHANYAVVPVENSTEGAVGRTLDLMCQTPLTICGEIRLRIRQNLLSTATTKPGAAATIRATASSGNRLPVGLFGKARNVSAGRCSAIASMKRPASSVKSAFSGTPT